MPPLPLQLPLQDADEETPVEQDVDQPLPAQAGMELRNEFVQLGRKLNEDLCREMRSALREALREELRASPTAIAIQPVEQHSARRSHDVAVTRPHSRERSDSPDMSTPTWASTRPLRGYLAQGLINNFPDGSASVSPVKAAPDTPTSTYSALRHTASVRGLARSMTSPEVSKRGQRPPLAWQHSDRPDNEDTDTLNTTLRIPTLPTADEEKDSRAVGACGTEAAAASAAAPASVEADNSNKTNNSSRSIKRSIQWKLPTVNPHVAMGLVPTPAQNPVLLKPNASRLHRALAFVVCNKFFERLALFVNFASAAAVGVQANVMAVEQIVVEPDHFRILDICFLAFFTLEAVLRLAVYRRDFIGMPGWAWNIFDLVLVVIQIVEELFVRPLLSRQHIGSSIGSSNVDSTWLLRMTRVLRTIKLFRIFGHIDEFRLLVSCFVTTGKSFAWAFLLLLVMNYVMATYLIQVVNIHVVTGNMTAQANAALQKWFGTLDAAIFSLLLGLTGGIDWKDMVDPIQAYTNVWTSVPLKAFMLLMILWLMNVVAATFVQNAIERADDMKQVNRVQQARRLFKSLDVDSSGFISFIELSTHLETPEVQKFFRDIDVDFCEARSLFDMLDVNNTGHIEFEDFLSGCVRLQGPAKSLDLLLLSRDMRGAFEKQAQQLRSLREICRTSGERLRLGVGDLV